MPYDPDCDPSPKQWLKLDESERLRLVEVYHRQNRIELPSPTAHASLHVMVENQVALGDKMTVKATLERLMGEGLTRHQAVHAIAMVLAEWIRLAGTKKAPKGDPNVYYREELKKLTAEKWRNLADEMEEDE